LLSSIEAAHPLQALRPAQRCVAGQRWQWDGVDFEILHPTEADYAIATRPNAVSCVLRIGNARATALLVGDIEKEQEAALVEQAPGRLAADLLLAPHHGSKTSSSAVFLDAVKPRLALAQTGYRNRFGHPAEEVAARYRERDVQLIDSPHCGALKWHSTTPGNAACQRDVARRYWHHAEP
jgi:competence protein ComEC